jgi:hypothetical protein
MGQPRIGADDPELAARVQAAYDEGSAMTKSETTADVDGMGFGRAILFLAGALVCFLFLVPFLAGLIARFVWWAFQLGWT